MSKQKSKSEIVASIVAAVVVIGLFVWVVNIIGGAMFGGTKKDTVVSDSGPGSSSGNPIEVTSTDGDLTAVEFANKYSNKWIKFDGLLSSTVGKTATIYLNDTSLTMLQISAIKSTFDDNLQSFASEYKADSPVPVKVTAYVEGHNDTADAVQLKLKSNVDGKTPSIVSR